MHGFQNLFWAMHWEVRINDRVNNLIIKSIVHQGSEQYSLQSEVLLSYFRFMSGKVVGTWHAIYLAE